MQREQNGFLRIIRVRLPALEQLKAKFSTAIILKPKPKTKVLINQIYSFSNDFWFLFLKNYFICQLRFLVFVFQITTQFYILCFSDFAKFNDDFFIMVFEFIIFIFFCNWSFFSYLSYVYVSFPLW